MSSTHPADSRRRGQLFCGRSFRIRRREALVVCATAALMLPGTADASAADVAALQVALRLQGVHAGAIDGIFGPETRSAVRRFQRRAGLTVDGIPGPRTRAALGAFARHRLGSRILRRGKVGWDVAALQYLLVRCGVPVGAIDGMFGARTRSAVLHYQHRAGLGADGLAGPATIASVRRALGCQKLKGIIPRGVTVSGLQLAGFSARWAATGLRSAFAEPLRLQALGDRWLADPDAFAEPKIGEAVRRAVNAHAGRHLRLGVTVQRSRIRAYAATVDRRICRPPADARLVGLRRLRPRITAARPGCHVLRSAFAHTLAQRVRTLDRSPIHVPTERLRPAVTRAKFGPVIVVRRGTHRLYLYRGVKRVRVFEVATGRRSNPTPIGRFRIVTKKRNPWWYPPAGAWANGMDPIPPGPGNPLGKTWMGLSVAAVGIHGTPDAASVGYSRSHGCIRMYPREAARLFRWVRIGTPVIIVRA